MAIEYDYDGDMKFYQDQLLKKGITKKMLNMDNYAGLTARELQSIVDGARLAREPICRCGNCGAAVMDQEDWKFDEEEHEPICLECGAFLDLPEGY